MVDRVQTVAALLIVQGAFEVAVGLLFSAFGLFAAKGLSRSEVTLPALPVEPMVAVAVLGPGLLAVGGLKILAGIRTFCYRGQLLGIVALASGALSVFTCYCAPTAIVLLVYGLVLYRRPEVQRAFVMGEQGLSPEWIRSSLGGRRGLTGFDPRA